MQRRNKINARFLQEIIIIINCQLLSIKSYFIYLDFKSTDHNTTRAETREKIHHFILSNASIIFYRT